MPKLKRPESAERATDFVESLDRGLRLLQKFGVTKVRSTPATDRPTMSATSAYCANIVSRIRRR